MRVAREKPEKRFAYAAGDDRGRVKLGHSLNPEVRRRNLQTGNASNVRLIHAEETDYKIAPGVERTARAILKVDHTGKREWINKCSDEDAINALKTAHEYWRGRNSDR